MTKSVNLRQLSVAELKKKLVEKEHDLVQAKIAKRAGKTVKGSIKLMADEIARLKTIIHEKELSV